VIEWPDLKLPPINLWNISKRNKMLKIYEEKKKEKIVNLKLQYVYGNHIRLVAVDGDGKELINGALLTISSTGAVLLHGGVDKTLGFQLDVEGRLLIGKD
jgi:hypothetical protein